MGALDIINSVFEPEKKEQIEIPEKEINKISTLTSLKSTLVKSNITESKIVFNYLKESGCIEDNDFYNGVYNSCRENLLKIA